MARDLTDHEKCEVNKKFDSFKSYNYSKEDVDKIIKNESKITSKSQRLYLAKYKEYISLFISMVKDMRKGVYKEIPKYSIAAITCTLIYIFIPLDIIPDFIPVIGLLDDSSMVALCIDFVSKDVEKYVSWKKRRDTLKKDYAENVK